jgi:hypothetical protein
MAVIQARPPYQLVDTRHGPMLANPNDIYVGQALLRYGEYGENVYGNLASFNMLALPSESTLVVEGLAQITDAGHHPLRRG